MQNDAVKKNFDIIEVLCLFLIFLFSANVINRYYFFLFGAFILFFVFKNGTIRRNTSVAALFILAASMLIFDPQYTTISILSVLKPFAFPLAYILGYNMVKNKGEDSEKASKGIILVLMFGMLAHIILNLSINIDNTDRNAIDYWTKEASSATIQAAIGVWTIAIAFAYLFSEAQNTKKLFFVLCALTVVYFNLILAGRTLLIIMAIIAVVALLHLLTRYKDGYNKRKTVIFFLIVIGILCYMFYNNIWGLREIIMDSNYHERMYGDYAVKIEDDGRMNNKLIYLENMLLHPFGGSKIRMAHNYISAHDLYLDVYDEASVFALIAVLVFIINSLRNLRHILIDEELSFLYKQVVLCVYIVCYIEFFVEPITRGIPWFLAAFCIMDGTVKAVLDINAKRKLQIE